MNEISVKGLGIKSTLSWLQDDCPEYLQVLSQCKLLPDKISDSSWYPLSTLNELYINIANFGGFSQDELGLAYRSAGRFVARDNIGAIYKALLRFVQPSTMGKTLPKMWNRYFTGLTATTSSNQQGSISNRISPMGDLAYISPVACGWIQFGYEYVGAKNVSVQEKNFSFEHPNPDVLEIVVEWEA